MKKIILLTFIIISSAALTGCMEGSGSGDGFVNIGGGDSPSGGSVINYYDGGSGSSGGSSGSGGDAAGGGHNPEPASLALLGAGLFGLLGSKLRRKKQ